MGFTVGQLKEALDDYGDHLPVCVLNTEEEPIDFTLGSGYVNNVVCVLLDITE